MGKRKNVAAEAARTLKACSPATAHMLTADDFERHLDETIEEYAQAYAWRYTPERGLEEALERIATGRGLTGALKLEIGGMRHADKIADLLLAFRKAESERLSFDILRRDRERIARFILLETMRRDEEKTIDESDLTTLMECAKDRGMTIEYIIDAAIEYDNAPTI